MLALDVALVSLAAADALAGGLVAFLLAVVVARGATRVVDEGAWALLLLLLLLEVVDVGIAMGADDDARGFFGPVFAYNTTEAGVYAYS